MHVASPEGRTHQRTRRQPEIPIALAARPLPTFPRLRASTLFRRRLADHAECLGVAGVQKPAQCTINLHNGRRLADHAECLGVAGIQKPAQYRLLAYLSKPLDFRPESRGANFLNFAPKDARQYQAASSDRLG